MIYKCFTLIYKSVHHAGWSLKARCMCIAPTERESHKCNTRDYGHGLFVPTMDLALTHTHRHQSSVWQEILVLFAFLCRRRDFISPSLDGQARRRTGPQAGQHPRYGKNSSRNLRSEFCSCAELCIRVQSFGVSIYLFWRRETEYFH